MRSRGPKPSAVKARNARRVFVSGATGFVGQMLVPVLEAQGAEVICGSRDPVAARERWPLRRWVRFELEASETIAPALEGCEAAAYLVHEMRSGEGYPAREASSAERFAHAARTEGVERLVYLGGVAPSGRPSRHLQSRLRTGEIFRAALPSALELRAGMILGAGSASWQMVRDLSERLPAMLLPRWTRFRSSPVSLDDVLVALSRALSPALVSPSAWFDLPGPETLTHEQMLLRASAVLGRRPAMFRIPLLSPRLSSHWIALVTRVDRAMARELVAGLESDLDPAGPSFWAHHCEGHPLIEFDAAVRLALLDEEGARQAVALRRDGVADTLRGAAGRVVARQAASGHGRDSDAEVSS